jgi:hypothetical protein
MNSVISLDDQVSRDTVLCIMWRRLKDCATTMRRPSILSHFKPNGVGTRQRQARANE